MTARHSGIGMTSQRTRLRMIERLRREGIRDEAVLAVMGALPRHIFVDEALASHAYEDMSLPIGFGQTISNPHTVARMTELALGGGALEKVLEIGTGCGYQTAVLAKLAKQVYSMERLAVLLNVNVPDVPYAELRGVQVTRLGRRHKAEPVVKASSPRGETVYWVGPAGAAQDAGEGTDFHAVANNRVSVTPLQVDLTRYSQLDALKEWMR